MKQQLSFSMDCNKLPKRCYRNNCSNDGRMLQVTLQLCNGKIARNLSFIANVQVPPSKCKLIDMQQYPVMPAHFRQLIYNAASQQLESSHFTLPILLLSSVRKTGYIYILGQFLFVLETVLVKPPFRLL